MNFQETETAASVRKILDQTKALNHLVSRFLEYGREFDLNREPTSLKDMIQTIEKNLQAPSAIQIRNEMKDCASVNLDAVLISNALHNLAANAIDAMPQGGTLTFRLEQTNSITFIEVEDTGTGIPENIKPDLFKPFFTTKSTGTGLGLAFAQKAVQAHGGKLEVFNGPQGGSLFRVSLPFEGSLS